MQAALKSLWVSLLIPLLLFFKGVSANHKKLYDACLKPCETCDSLAQERLSDKNYTVADQRCGNNACQNWDALADMGGSMEATTPVSLSYPKVDTSSKDEWSITYRNHRCCRILRDEQGEPIVEKEGGMQRIKPFRLSYEDLQEAIKLAHHCYANGTWTLANAKAYLEAECIEKDFIDQIMDHALNAFVWDEYEKNKENDPSFPKDVKLESHHARFEHLYKPMELPQQWKRSHFDLSLHPDVIMHLCFLGIAKKCMQTIQRWLKAKSQFKSFMKANAQYFECFKEANIEILWLMIMPYRGEKFGSWVSENFLGARRVLRWFYQNIGEAERDTTEEPDESTPVSKWLKAECICWLQQRGLDKNGDVAELKKRIEKCKEEGEPPKLPALQSGTEMIQEVLNALNELLECIMTEVVNTKVVNRTRMAVRRFLTVFDKLDSLVQKKDKDAHVINVYNFPCLLNLPDMMERFGPLRELWEGGPKGEGFLRFVKPFFIHGFKFTKNWPKHLLKNVLISKSFDNLLWREDDLNVPPSHVDALKSRSRQFHAYKNYADVRAIYSEEIREKKKPLSTIIVEEHDQDAKMYVVYKTADCEFRLIEVTLDMRREMRVFGMSYYHAEINTEEMISWDNICLGVVRIGFAVMLPVLCTDESAGKYHFAVTASNWTTLGESADNFAQMIANRHHTSGKDWYEEDMEFAVADEQLDAGDS